MKQEVINTVSDWIAEMTHDGGKWRVLVVTGVPCSGKTTLIHAIAQVMQKPFVALPQMRRTLYLDDVEFLHGKLVVCDMAQSLSKLNLPPSACFCNSAICPAI